MVTPDLCTLKSGQEEPGDPRDLRPQKVPWNWGPLSPAGRSLGAMSPEMGLIEERVNGHLDYQGRV